MNNTVSTILGIATLLSIAAGGLYGLDKTYARETKVEKTLQYVQYVDKSLQLKSERDIHNSQQSNYFVWEKEYGPDGVKSKDPKVKDKMFEMRQGLAIQEKRVKDLERNIVKPE